MIPHRILTMMAIHRILDSARALLICENHTILSLQRQEDWQNKSCRNNWRTVLLWTNRVRNSQTSSIERNCGKRNKNAMWLLRDKSRKQRMSKGDSERRANSLSVNNSKNIDSERNQSWLIMNGSTNSKRRLGLSARQPELKKRPKDRKRKTNSSGNVWKRWNSANLYKS